MLWELDFVISCIGVFGLKRVVNRESIIKKFHSKHPFCYLWFIGVHPDNQSKGIGSILMEDIINDSIIHKNKPIYLETSSSKNIPWYQSFGFEIYNEVDLNYKLYLLRKPVIN